MGNTRNSSHEVEIEAEVEAFNKSFMKFLDKCSKKGLDEEFVFANLFFRSGSLILVNNKKLFKGILKEIKDSESIIKSETETIDGCIH